MSNLQVLAEPARPLLVEAGIVLPSGSLQGLRDEMMKRLHNVPQLKDRRRQLRSSPTPAEALLWKNLQRSQLDARKFRRQHSVGRYILDFYCPACRLAVELDGQGHFDSTRSDYDVKRMQFLEQQGIHVLRFENRQIFESLEEVLETIRGHLKTSKWLYRTHGSSLPQILK